MPYTSDLLLDLCAEVHSKYFFALWCLGITGNITSVKIIRCRDDTVPKTVDTIKKPLQGMVESMQQSSATPKNRDVGRGLRKIVVCSQPYLAVASCIYSFWHGVIPTSYF